MLKSMFTHVVETRPQLTFAKNEPLMMGMSVDALAAAGRGSLGETSLREWGKKKDEILKGFGELKEFFLNPAATPAAGK